VLVLVLDQPLQPLHSRANAPDAALKVSDSTFSLPHLPERPTTSAVCGQVKVKAGYSIDDGCLRQLP
jgi:hypothetical protein